MDGKGLKGHIIQLGKIDFVIPDVLEIAEGRMMHYDQQRERYLQFPILIGDQNCAADKGDEMHFEQPMHLIDILGHEYAEYQAYDILVSIRIGKESPGSIIGDHGKAAYADADKPVIIKECEQQSAHEKTDKEIVHQLVRLLLYLVQVSIVHRLISLLSSHRVIFGYRRVTCNHTLSKPIREKPVGVHCRTANRWPSAQSCFLSRNNTGSCYNCR